MEGMSTALRAFFTRRLDPTNVYSYALLIGLMIAVVVIGAMDRRHTTEEPVVPPVQDPH